jgi:hypothetical protein
MLYRAKKFVVSTANVVLIWLTFRLLTGHADWQFAAESLALSGFWLVLTLVALPQVFREYFNTLVRWRRFVLPFLVGTVLSGVALVTGGTVPWIYYGSVSALLCWALTGTAYVQARRFYIKTKKGLVPVDVWLNPDPRIIKPGDMILSSGIGGSFGHAEVAFLGRDGVMKLFSVWLKKGACVHDADYVLRRYRETGEHCVVLRIRQELTAEKIARGPDIADDLLARNHVWAELARQRFTTFFRFVPMPKARKQALVDKLSTGFDPFGVFTGAISQDHWICIVGCLKFYEEWGIEMPTFGKGLFGFGTGWFDMIRPDPFLRAVKYFLVANKEDERLWNENETLTPLPAAA